MRGFPTPASGLDIWELHQAQSWGAGRNSGSHCSTDQVGILGISDPSHVAPAHDSENLPATDKIILFSGLIYQEKILNVVDGHC